MARLFWMTLFCFVAFALAVLPPGYEDKLLCPCDYCLSPKNIPHKSGPASMFWECKKSDGKVLPVKAWGTIISTEEKLDGLVKQGYHELECGKSSAYACKAKTTGQACKDHCSFDQWGNIAFDKVPEFAAGTLSQSKEMKLELVQGDKQSLGFEFQLKVADCVAKEQIHVAIHKAIDPESDLGKQCKGQGGLHSCYPLKACDETNEIISTRAGRRLGHFANPKIELDNIITTWTSTNRHSRVRGSFRYKSDNDVLTQTRLDALWHARDDKILFCVRVEITNCENFLILSEEKLVEVEIQKKDSETFDVRGEALVAYKNHRDKIFEVVPDGVHKTITFHIFPCARQQRFNFRIGANCWERRVTRLEPDSSFGLCIVSREENWVTNYEMTSIYFTIPNSCKVCDDQRSQKCLAMSPRAGGGGGGEVFQIWPNDFWNADVAVVEPQQPGASDCMLYDNGLLQGYYLNVRLHERFFLDCNLQFSGTIKKTT